MLEQCQGRNVGCPEEVAYRMGYLDVEGLRRSAARLPESPYRDYVEQITNEESW